MPATNFNWAEQIEKAQNASTEFNPLDPGTYNFEIKETSIKNWDDGNSNINYRATVVGGPSDGKFAFQSLDPFSDRDFAAKNFLDVWRAIGYSIDTLIQNNPSLEQIMQAVTGRKFTADLTHGTKKDSKGNPRMFLNKIRPVEAETPQDQSDGAGTSFGTPPAPTTPAEGGFGGGTGNSNPWGGGDGGNTSGSGSGGDAGNPWV